MVARNEKGQFATGVSGNPAGRKPRETERYFLDLFRDCVSDTDFKLVVDAIVKAAKRGNTSAAKIIFDYLMGPPVQKNILAGDDEQPIKIVVEYVDSTATTT